MGLLSLGTALTWEETQKYADHVRFHGITQFLNTWDRSKDRNGDGFLWGDEVPCLSQFVAQTDCFQKIECMVISFDNSTKNAKLSLCQTEILEKLHAAVDELSEGCPKPYVQLLPGHSSDAVKLFAARLQDITLKPADLW